MDDLRAQGQPRGAQVEHSRHRRRPGDDRDDELRKILEENVSQELPPEPDMLEPAQRVALRFCFVFCSECGPVANTADNII